MSQTSVGEQGIARVGLLADLGLRDTLSFAGEEAIPFGALVVRGTNAEKQCKLPAADTDISDAKKVLGVAVAVQTQEVPFPTNTANPTYIKDYTVSVLTFGRIWVRTESAATDPTKDVYVRHTAAGALNVIGGFSDAAGTGLEKLDNAKWMGNDRMVDGVQLALLQVRL